MLLSFTDFQVFKEMMIDYKYRLRDRRINGGNFKNGKNENFFNGLTIEKAEKFS